MEKNEQGLIKRESLPELIEIGNYVVHFDLKYLNSALEDWENDYGLDLDPDFQRGHVWTMKQRTLFMEFLLKGGKIHSPIIFNSPAWSGRNADGDLDQTIIIVDGKQRLTTMQMFMENEVPVFGNHYLKDFEHPQALCRNISFTVAVNHLQTRKELLQFYIELNEGHVAHKDSEIERIKALLREQIEIERINTNKKILDSMIGKEACLLINKINPYSITGKLSKQGKSENSIYATYQITGVDGHFVFVPREIDRFDGTDIYHQFYDKT